MSAEKFREELYGKLNLEKPESRTVFAAMDYHLDWLAAALQLFHLEKEKECFPNPSDLVQGNQEDVEFLIAWKEKEDFHVVLVEAKDVLVGQTHSLSLNPND